MPLVGSINNRFVMIEPIIYSTENDNLYIFDDQHRLSMLIHPEFEKAYKQSPDADSYYLKKYMYLKEHGFFIKLESLDFLDLEESEVRENIINTHQIVFEVTDACNLNCTYCALGEFYEGYDERIGKKINTNYAINLLKYVFDISPKNKNRKLFISFYGGEALLNMKFIKQIVEVANQLNVEKEFKLMYSMTTNATLIHKYIDFLVVNKFGLLVSLDGNEGNHSYRVFKKSKINSFSKVIRNMDMVQRNYPEYFATYVNFNAVLHDRNSVKEIYEFIYKRYNKIPRISELNIRDVKQSNKELLEKMFRNRRKSEIQYQKEGSDLFHQMHGELSSYNDLIHFLRSNSINYYISNINALLSIQEKQLSTGTCTPFSRKIFMTNRDKLLPCEKISYQYYMGKVNENIDIDIPEITRQYNFYYERLKKFCKVCYAYRFCRTCLFHLKNIGNIDAKEFVCENFHDKQDFKNKLQHIFSFLEKYPNDFSEIIENIIIE